MSPRLRVRLAFVAIALLLTLSLVALSAKTNRDRPVHVHAAQTTTTTVLSDQAVPPLGPQFGQLVAAYRIERPKPKPARTPRRAAGSVIHGMRCGDDLPPCYVMFRESRGNPTAVNPTGCGGRTCGGKWQFDPVTFSPDCTVSRWNGHGEPCALYQGYRFAQDAPVDVQDQRAREVWDDGDGCSHWGVC